MLVSTKGRYALRMMIYLGQTKGNAPVSLSEISEDEQISIKYLEQIARDLVRIGLLKGVRGARGGYLLNKPAEEITVGAILRAVEESGISCVSCLSENAEKCERFDMCPTRDLWHDLNSDINDFLDTRLLSQLC